MPGHDYIKLSVYAEKLAKKVYLMDKKDWGVLTNLNFNLQIFENYSLIIRQIRNMSTIFTEIIRNGKRYSFSGTIQSDNNFIMGVKEFKKKFFFSKKYCLHTRY